MKTGKILVAISVLVLSSQPPLTAEVEPLAKLATDLSRQLEKAPGKKIAVLSIPHHNKLRSPLSGSISEDLAARLAADKRLQILDRRHIQELLKEMNLSETGLLDQKSSEVIGNALGADILVTGTLIDLEEGQEINLRGFLVSTGRVVAAGRTLLPGGAKRSDPLRSLAKKLIKTPAGKLGPTLAVLDFTYPRGRVSTGSFLIAERVLTFLVQEGQPVIERRLLQTILEEKHLVDTGLMKPSESSDRSKILCADALVVGTLADNEDGTTSVLARVIDLGSTRILSVASVLIPRIWGDQPRLPQFMQPYTPVPIMVFQSPAGTSTGDAGGYHTLNELTPGKGKPRYYPAPVPYFSPSMEAINKI